MTRFAAAASAVAVLAVLTGAVAGGCVNDVPIGSDFTAGTAAGSSGSGTLNGGSAGATGGGSSGTANGGSSGDLAGAGGEDSSCRIALCGTRLDPYECGDCDDNDLDGSTDADDSECLGPCDNTEDSYYPNIPGQDGGSCRLDCYFDPGSGTNDQCYSSFRCDPYSIEPDYPPSGEAACAYDPTANIPGTNASCAELYETQSDSCHSECDPLVPNGCDCFGCCELPAGSDQFVWIGSTEDGAGSCTEATVHDPAACHPCTPMPSCINPCDDCEVCAGRQTPSENCTSGESGQCPTGRAACGLPGQPSCSPGQYCITGCCVIEPR
jgi:hypothetical protein